MGKAVTNPQKFVLRLKIGTLAYGPLISLGRTVAARMLTNIAIFPAPAPSLINLNAAITDAAAAWAAHGTKRNKGSEADTIDLRAKITTLRVMLIEEAGYVLQTLSPTADVPTFNAQLLLAGFAVKSKRSRASRLQQPKFMRQTNNKTFPTTMHRINWRKGNGMLKGIPVAAYNVYSNGVLIGSTTKGNWIVDLGVDTHKTIIVKPSNARGEGNAMQITVR